MAFYIWYTTEFNVAIMDQVGLWPHAVARAANVWLENALQSAFDSPDRGLVVMGTASIFLKDLGHFSQSQWQATSVLTQIFSRTAGTPDHALATARS